MCPWFLLPVPESGSTVLSRQPGGKQPSKGDPAGQPLPLQPAAAILAEADCAAGISPCGMWEEVCSKGNW